MANFVDLSREQLKDNLPDIGDKPSQPLSISFLKREYGKSILVKRLFRISGSASGNGYTMTRQGTWHFVILAS